MTFTIYPAIDIRRGKVVRLRQGDFDRQTTYSTDPVSAALNYAELGARWLHLVDLDASRYGTSTILPALENIVSKSNLNVQIGGGVRTAEDIILRLNAGATRVVIGTFAIKHPELVFEWLQHFGSERICVALDSMLDSSNTWTLPVEAWTKSSDQKLFSLLKRYQASGLKHLLCTDIRKDGMLGGIDPELYISIREQFPSISTQVSGGVKDLTDVVLAKATGADGVVIGRALLEGKLSLSQALAC